MPRFRMTARRSTCGCGCGRLTPINRKTDKSKWNIAKRLAYRIAFLSADKMDYALKYPIRLLKAFHETGTYGVTYRAKGVDRVTATYNARVYVRNGANLDDIEITYLVKVAGSETPERPKRKVARVSRSSSMSDCTDDELEISPKLASVEESTKPRPQGFYRLVAQIRSQRPNLTFAKVRKMASVKWRSFSEDEKMAFMDEVDNLEFTE
ncbi:hypothetical protein RND81_11G198400 [Saponaria officinalis]|uniref:HMG box domain-containing protein n=1 Tax=Saponaria officinalis TaxID=3572 RepID=A0AAW1HPX4_SAPOF